MYSPNEGLKEINHQLSTGVAQELIHYCNSLGQGVSDYLPFCSHTFVCAVQACLRVPLHFSDGDFDYLLDSATVDSSEPSPLSSSQESSEERNLKTTNSPKGSQTQCSKELSSPKERGSSPKDTCSGENQTV